MEQFPPPAATFAGVTEPDALGTAAIIFLHLRCHVSIALGPVTNPLAVRQQVYRLPRTDEGRDPDCHGGADTAAALNKRQPQQDREKKEKERRGGGRGKWEGVSNESSKGGESRKAGGSREMPESPGKPNGPEWKGVQESRRIQRNARESRKESVGVDVFYLDVSKFA